MKLTVQGHKLTKRPNQSPMSPSPSYFITKGLFATIPFTQDVMSGYQQKVARNTKRQKQHQQQQQRRQQQS